MNWPDKMAQALVDIADELSGWEDADLEELRAAAERAHALVRGALPPGTLEGHGEEASDGA